MRLRPATPEDATVVARIHHEARRTAMPWLADPGGWDGILHFVTETLLPTGTVTVAVTDDDEVIGMSGVADGWLHHLYIDPAHQGTGVGSALFDDALERSRGELTFWVFQRNDRARRFYEKRGARPIRFTSGVDNMEREPDVLYTRPSDSGS